MAVAIKLIKVLLLLNQNIFIGITVKFLSTKAPVMAPEERAGTDAQEVPPAQEAELLPSAVPKP